MNRTLLIIAGVLGGIMLLAYLSGYQGWNDFGGDPARLVYLGILGAVLAAGIFGSGMRFGYMARSLGLWALVILVLIAGYQYRYELQDIASRVTAGLIPGSPLTIGADGDTVMLEKMSNGHFEARATINGKTIQVMVDTGATSTVLTVADARIAGYDPAGLSFTVPISTANGTAFAARVDAEEIAVGPIARRNLVVLVASSGMLERSLLGMNFIGTLSGFEVRGDRMILRD